MFHLPGSFVTYPLFARGPSDTRTPTLSTYHQLTPPPTNQPPRTPHVKSLTLRSPTFHIPHPSHNRINLLPRWHIVSSGVEIFLRRQKRSLVSGQRSNTSLRLTQPVCKANVPPPNFKCKTKTNETVLKVTIVGYDRTFAIERSGPLQSLYVDAEASSRSVGASHCHGLAPFFAPSCSTVLRYLKRICDKRNLQLLQTDNQASKMTICSGHDDPRRSLLLWDELRALLHWRKNIVMQ